MRRAVFVLFVLAVAFFETRYVSDFARYIEIHGREEFAGRSVLVSLYLINLGIVALTLVFLWAWDDRNSWKKIADEWREAHSNLVDDTDEIATRNLKLVKENQELAAARKFADERAEDLAAQARVHEGRAETLRARHEAVEAWAGDLAAYDGKLMQAGEDLAKRERAAEEARSEIALWRDDLNKRSAALDEREAFLASEGKTVADRSAALVQGFLALEALVARERGAIDPGDASPVPGPQDPEIGAMTGPYRRAGLEAVDEPERVQSGPTDADLRAEFHRSKRTVDMVTGAIKMGPFRTKVFGDVVLPAGELENAKKCGWRETGDPFLMGDIRYVDVTRS